MCTNKIPGYTGEKSDSLRRPLDSRCKHSPDLLKHLAYLRPELSVSHQVVLRNKRSYAGYWLILHPLRLRRITPPLD